MGADQRREVRRRGAEEGGGGGTSRRSGRRLRRRVRQSASNEERAGEAAVSAAHRSSPVPKRRRWTRSDYSPARAARSASSTQAHELRARQLLLRWLQYEQGLYGKGRNQGRGTLAESGWETGHAPNELVDQQRALMLRVQLERTACVARCGKPLITLDRRRRQNRHDARTLGNAVLLCTVWSVSACAVRVRASCVWLVI